MSDQIKLRIGRPQQSALPLSYVAVARSVRDVFVQQLFVRRPSKRDRARWSLRQRSNST